MRNAAALLAVVGTAAIASVASADVIFTCEVTAYSEGGAELGSHTWQFEIPSGLNPQYDTISGGWGEYQFGPNNELPGENNTPWDLGGGALVHGVGVTFREDPQVQLNFNVASGFANMSFTVNSSIVSFAPIAPATGYASAFVGLTDSSFIGTPGTIGFTGQQPGGKAYSSLYNPSLTPFAHLITGGTFNGANGFSTSTTENFGTAGSQVPIGGAVNEIRSQFRFNLTAGDRASGTSIFEVTPAPGGVALFGIAGLLAARRRRN